MLATVFNVFGKSLPSSPRTEYNSRPRRYFLPDAAADGSAAAALAGTPVESAAGMAVDSARKVLRERAGGVFIMNPICQHPSIEATTPCVFFHLADFSRRLPLAVGHCCHATALLDSVDYCSHRVRRSTLLTKLKN